MMAKFASRAIVIILLIQLIKVESVNITKKNDNYNYYLTSDYENPAISRSDLIVINQSDPNDNYQGFTYDYLNFITEIRTNERNLMGFIDDCTGTCSHYTNNSQLSNTDYIKNDTDYCPGRLRDCVLYKEPEGDNNGANVYGFENWLLLSFKQQDVKTFIKNRGVLLQATCPTCKCYCDDHRNPTLTASFCLDVISSNIIEGYVVTGVRFKIINQIVRIQIQQGKLLDNEIIDSTTRHWQDVDECKVSKRMDYDHRSLQMDDVILTEGSIVTGISLSETPDSKGLYLSVYGKQTRELKIVNIAPKEYFSPPGNRINLMNSDMDISTAYQKNNTELSIPGQHYVTFQPMGLRKNNHVYDPQLMPFLDIRDVISVDDTKLVRGVGIYWRGQEGYGGYVAFQLFVDKYPVEVKIINDNM